MNQRIGAAGRKAQERAERIIELLGLAPAKEDAAFLNRLLERIAGPSRALDESIRSRMEAILGRDLSRVRLHASREAGMISARLGGQAFAVMQHVYGPREELDASTEEGAGLLAHELQHTVQQSRAPVVRRKGTGTASENGDDPEDEAGLAEKSARRRRKGAAHGAVDSQDIARRVYALMLKDTRLARERRPTG